MKTASAQLPKQRYRAPTVSACADVSLDEFSHEDIVSHLRHSGYAVVESSDGPEPDEEVADAGLYIAQADINRIATLALCGQQAAAREVVCRLIGDYIGRSIA